MLTKISSFLNVHGTIVAGTVGMAATVLGLSVVPAWAMTVYSDSFPGSSSSPLNGTSPATDSTGATWSAGANWNADGSYSSAGGYQNAFLPFAPATGEIYTLAATVDPVATGTGKWLALGFAEAAQTSQPFYGSAINPGPWMFQWAVSNGEYSPGPALTAVTYDPNGGASSPASLEVVLNTTRPQWTAQWYVDGNAVLSTPYAYAVNPTITSVGFGSDMVSGTISNFSLAGVVAPVPEPDALALLAVGGCLGLLLLRRRRSSGVGC